MTFYPGLQIEATKEPLGFSYGQGVFGPKEEVRRLEDIRHSLEDKIVTDLKNCMLLSWILGMKRTEFP